jgi:hypothetical protein
LVAVKAEFFWKELAAPWVHVVVAMDLGVTFEAHGNCVLDAIFATLCHGLDVVGFDLYTAEAVTDAASPMAPRQQL